MVSTMVPPANTSPPTISGTPARGMPLTASHGAWRGDPGSYNYRWEDCDAAGSACAPIVDATGSAYTPTNSDVGDTIRVLETASNAGGASVPVSSAPTVVVTPLAPVAAGGSPPTIFGAAVEGQTLTESHGTWTNRPDSYSYQWEDCDTARQNCTPIAGATGQSYRLAASDIGARIKVVETASNAGGASDPVGSAATATVPESGPVGAVIDDGDYASNHPNVLIDPVWPPGTTGILISNNDGFRTDVETVAPASAIPWTLERTGYDRLPKTVYLRFLGVGMNDINFTPNIILDETNPTIQSATLTSAGQAVDLASAARAAGTARTAKLHNYGLRIDAADKLVGVCAVATANRRAANGQTVTILASCTTLGILKLNRTFGLRLPAAPR